MSRLEIPETRTGMSHKSPLREKSVELGVATLVYTQKLRSIKFEQSVINQFVRSGTAVGALVAEAGSAESKADMHHKFGISLKEARETGYWLELIGRIITIDEEYNDITLLLSEVIAMLVASRNTLKRVKSEK